MDCATAGILSACVSVIVVVVVVVVVVVIFIVYVTRIYGILFFSFLDYPKDWSTSMMYSYVRLWLIIISKKKEKERGRGKNLVRCTNIV
jgi:hypothetical protein